MIKNNTCKLKYLLSKKSLYVLFLDKKQIIYHQQPMVNPFHNKPISQWLPLAFFKTTE